MELGLEEFATSKKEIINKPTQIPWRLLVFTARLGDLNTRISGELICDSAVN